MAPTTSSSTLSVSPAPGPGSRVSRTAGQGGAALVFVQLWQAFGWLGADGWSEAEAAARWPAVTAATILVVAACQNAVNYWRDRRSVDVEIEVDPIEVDAVEEAAEVVVEDPTGGTIPPSLPGRLRPRIGPG